MRVVVLATGGTIAGVGEPGKNTGYESGQIAGADLVAAVPGIAECAEVHVEQVCNVNSDDMTGALWLKLARRIDEISESGFESKPVDGFVITHGTDTMDETAFFLSFTLRTSKPVVMTGSMRPATAEEPDGPANLLCSVKGVASLANGNAKLGGNNVWVCFGGKFYSALKVQKCSASDLQPMHEDAFDDSSELPFFDVCKLENLPRVNVVYFAVDSDPRILEYVASVSDGVVIAGAGSGEFSKEFAEALRNVKVPVVVCSRINHGYVTLNESLACGRVSAGHLPPQKAAVLLRLVLTKVQEQSKVNEYFKVFA